MRTSFHHQPEAQHPNFPLSVSWQADYPIFRHCVRHGRAWRVSANLMDDPRECYGTHDAGGLQGFHCPQLRGTVPERTLHAFPAVQGESAT